MFEEFLTAEAIDQLKAAEAASGKEQKRTAEQIEAIYGHGQNILVSASAGSGKTFVMVERIIDMLTRGVAINQLFISTFTVKAASELKERLEKKLAEVIKVEGNEAKRQHLSLQLAAIQTADIGTMDAFTQRLVKEEGYRLGLSPKFRILQDRAEQELFQQEIFDDLFADYIRGKDSQAFKALVKNFVGSGKDASAFRQVVYQLYDFLQSTSNPKAWLTDRFMPVPQPLVWEERLRQLRLVLLETADELEKLTESEGYTKETKTGKVSATYSKDLVMIDGLRQQGLVDTVAVSQAVLEGILADLQTLLPSSAEKTVNKVKYPVYAAVKACLADLQKSLFIHRHQDGAEDHLLLLRAFMLDFCDQYLAKKRAENAFEFADISHLAIRILEEEEPVRQAYQDRYVEVMVDEYQDTNHTQERLLELLSRGDNRFMVGDIKQSIYRFRQADPQIFNQKFKQYQAQPEVGRLIVLKENFRSHATVLDTTNALFAGLMDEQVGEVTYDQTHLLVAGSDQQKKPAPDQISQLLLYDDQNAKEKDQSDIDAEEKGAPLSRGELLMVAQEILRLHREDQVPFKDITILASSRNSYKAIIPLFEDLGIPLQTDGGKPNYLQSVDVMVMLDALRTIYNPLTDYALVALLKSPMFAFDEDDLTRLAVQDEEGQFYQKLSLALSREGLHPDLISGGLMTKLQTFQTYLTKWRSYAKSHSLYDLIWQIYHDRFYYDYVGLLRNGAQRQANLYALATRAKQFEQTGFKGLPRFIYLIDNLLKNQRDLANVDLPVPTDAVSLMTIHKSKGLEFPYVFVLDLNKRFNQDEEHGKLIVDRQMGVGIQYVVDIRGEFDEKDRPLPPQVLVALPTLAYEANKKALHLANLSEQMRLLYVAMTRASRRLYLVGKANQEQQEERAEIGLEAGRLPLGHRQTLATFQDWFLALLTSRTPEQLALEVVYRTDADLEVTPLESTSPNRLEDDQSQNRQSQLLEDALTTLRAVDQLNTRYQAAINLPSLQTPSQIKPLYQPVLPEGDLLVMDQVNERPEVAFEPINLGQVPELTGAAVGSAIHELMQRITLSQTVSRADIEAAFEATQAPEEVKASLDLTKVTAFFQTDLGQLLQKHWAQVVREAPFAMLEQDPVSGEDFVIRGIVDGFIPLSDRLVLYDFKTDRYQEPQDLVRRYQGQMALYAKALRQAYHQLPVLAYLVLFFGDKVEVVEVPLKD